MIYPKDFENKIGFNLVRDKIIDFCETRLGKELSTEMAFSSDRAVIEKNLRAVSEMVSLLSSRVTMPSDTTHDILPLLVKIKSEGSYLSPEEISKIGVTLKTMISISQFFKNSEENGTDKYPVLSSMFSGLPVFNDLIREIDRCIGKFGEIKDSASIELQDIRKSINQASSAMQRSMRSVLDKAIREGVVEKDSAPTVRDGRLVLAVAATGRRQIPGLVHDRSATGKTVFIEPLEVIEASNRIKELQLEENRIIIEILLGLCQSIRPEIEEISRGCHELAQFDFVRAKSKFAFETDGQLPVIEKYPEIDWYHAIHPGLLYSLRKVGKTPVPLDIQLNRENRILVISGPNAGGKSVCLKTVAVVQYMMQCGILPTLYSNSHMGIFKNIFIDIGDEQSIENDLSTYSSHLFNMKVFLTRAGKDTLILADEMGSGTEPMIGGALAQAILTELGKKQCFGIVTTHFQNLKAFADSEPGFINGAMLYDRQHLQPTFQLSIGTPGSSFALEIARKTGLPLSVVDMAKETVGKEYVEIEKFLLDIQKDRRYWQNKRASIKEKEQKLDKLLSSYEETASELKSKRNSILREAKEEAREILASANTKIERSISEIRKAEAEKEKTKKIRLELENYKKDLENIDTDKNSPEILKPLRHKSSNLKKKEKERTGQKDKERNTYFKVDDYVKMSNGGGTSGKIIRIEGKKAEVAFGAIRTLIPLSQLVRIEKSSPEQTVTVSTLSDTDSGSRQRQLNFKNEIDVRGMRADEAVQAVVYFIDDAIQFDISRVRILHGTGHGILKTMIRQQLQSNPRVKSIRDEDVRFGGAGITVVDFE